MIACTENCKYQINGECTYQFVDTPKNYIAFSNCAYFEQEN